MARPRQSRRLPGATSCRSRMSVERSALRSSPGYCRDDPLGPPADHPTPERLKPRRPLPLDWKNQRRSFSAGQVWPAGASGLNWARDQNTIKSASMGRLTLNVILSFAQFEREVAGERIRDKIAL